LPRACVIVLDARRCGRAGPMAADYGDEGSNTLGKHRGAPWVVSTLPTMEGAGARERRAAGRLSSATLALPPSPAACSSVSRGKDTTTGQLGADGHRHAEGDADVPARLPRRGDRPVHEIARSRCDRQRACQRDGDHPGARRGALSAPANGSSTRAPTRCSRSPRTRRRLPLEELYEACGVRRARSSPGKHAVGRVIARPFVASPGAYQADAEPPRLLARATSAETTSRCCAPAVQKVYGVGKISDIFAGCDVDESSPTKSNVEGIPGARYRADAGDRRGGSSS